MPSGKPRALGKKALCRVPDHTLGKYLFAECLPLGKDKHSAKTIFAECQTLGKKRRSAKGVLDKRHAWSSPLPSALPLGTRQRSHLCRGPSTRQKACHVAGLGSARATAFAECHVGRHSAKSSLPSANPSTRQSVIFFLIFLPNFFVGP